MISCYLTKTRVMAHFSLFLQEHMGVMRKIVLEELLNGHLLYVDGKTKKN